MVAPSRRFLAMLVGGARPAVRANVPADDKAISDAPGERRPIYLHALIEIRVVAHHVPLCSAIACSARSIVRIPCS